VIAFFDMFDYPLTFNEIWLYLSVKGELSEVIMALEEWSESVISTSEGEEKSLKGESGKYKGFLPTVEMTSKNGFYFLAGRGAIVEERLRRYNFTGRKFKRAILVSKIFKFIPWIRMIAVGNLMGGHNLKDSSDIDFFIVAENKRIWLVRFFCAGLAKFLGLRPQAGNSRDKICLSFYASDRAMELNGLMLNVFPNAALKGFLADARNDNAKEDIYFIHWLAGLTPIYDQGGVYEKLISANPWLKNYFPNWTAAAFAMADKETMAGKRPVFLSRWRDAGSPLPRFYRDAVDLFFGGLEPQFKALQLKLLPLELKNLMNRDSRVIINDQIIKLHVNDRREEYRKKYFEKINNLL